MQEYLDIINDLLNVSKKLEKYDKFTSDLLLFLTTQLVQKGKVVFSQNNSCDIKNSSTEIIDKIKNIKVD